MLPGLGMVRPDSVLCLALDPGEGPGCADSSIMEWLSSRFSGFCFYYYFFSVLSVLNVFSQTTLWSQMVLLVSQVAWSTVANDD